MNPKGKVVMIPNGFNAAHFTEIVSEEKINKIRNELGVSSADTLLVTSSRLVLKNGLIDVIRSLPLQEISIKFLILGVGELEADLKNEVDKLGLKNRVFFKGFVP